MADIVITPADVLPSAAAQILQGIAGATIAQGETLYVDTANNNVLKLSDANGSTPANTVAGIALNAASSGQIINYVARDPALIIGNALTAADILFLSINPGQITKTIADVTSGSTLIVLGACVTGGAATVATVNFNPTVGGIVP